MDVTREKSDLFGQIAALRVTSESYPNFYISNSLPSISQSKNSLEFLVDLTKSLIGFEALKETLVDILTHNLEDIEDDVKKSLKSALKSLVSCGVNPSLPNSFINDGIDLELRNIDFLDLFKINPTSDAGKLLYNDVNSGFNSNDFNTFLYEVIQDNGGTSSWGNQTLGVNILDVNFIQQANTVNAPNNVINFKSSSTFTSDKLIEFNNRYIDSIKLFNTNKIINSVIDSIFGTISFKVGRNKRKIENEEKINDIIDKIINADDEVIDNSFFTFSNQEIADIENKAELRRKGYTLVETCDNIKSRIPFESIVELDNQLDSLNDSSSPEFIEQKANIVRNSLDELAQQSANNVNSNDKFTVQLNFIERMLKTIMKSLIGVLLSPKLISVMALNHMIVNGNTFNSVEDFMKQNKILVNEILISIRESIVSIILDRVLKEIKTLVSENVIATQIERVKIQKTQLASLLGTQTDVLRNISGLN